MPGDQFLGTESTENMAAWKQTGCDHRMADEALLIGSGLGGKLASFHKIRQTHPEPLTVSSQRLAHLAALSE